MHGYTENKDAYLKRLRRIEGQIRGLQRMVDEDKYCIDILTQVAAATKALQSVALGLLEEHLGHCVAGAIAEGGDTASEKVREASDAIARLVKILKEPSAAGPDVRPTCSAAAAWASRAAASCRASAAVKPTQVSWSDPDTGLMPRLTRSAGGWMPRRTRSPMRICRPHVVRKLRRWPAWVAAGRICMACLPVDTRSGTSARAARSPAKFRPTPVRGR